MEAIFYVCIFAVLCVFFVPVLLFRPLLTAIANRIGGKVTDTAELKAMQQRIAALEQQLDHMHVRLACVEETNEFAKHLLEDLSKKTVVDAAEDKQ